VSDLLPLTYAGFNYLDRTVPLQLGEIEPAGIDLTYVTIREIGDLFRRMAQYASEMSLSTLMLMVGRGDKRLVGIPVFPSRSFRHGFLFVSTASGIETPADLRGKRVGVQDYQATAYVWIRALLEHDFSVAPSDFEWYIGGLDTPSPLERLRHDPPPGVTLRPVPRGKTIEGMLLDGDLDAVFSPERLFSLQTHSGTVRRLFFDHPDVEGQYFARTGFFPIMHTVVIRRDLYEANRWIACALLDAFEASKRAGMTRLRRVTSPALSLPWLQDALDDLDAAFNGDAFPYGFAANRAIVEAMTEYSYEQGLSESRVRPEDLFASETWEHQPCGAGA
jgi:4,5-dihydroxyphthalate decarboxylase